MGTQDFRANYRAAMQEANSQLAELFREFEQLQLRKELIEDALDALEAFRPSVASAAFDSYPQESVRPEPVRYEREVPAPQATVAAAANEPVAPAAFAVDDIIADPIQSRINRALGLAVA